MKLARAWFGLLLRLFPAGFRDRHGGAMRETFSRACAERRSAGWPTLAVFLVRTSVDLVISGVLQRFARRRHEPAVSPGRSGGGQRLVSWLDVKLGLRLLPARRGGVTSRGASATGGVVRLHVRNLADTAG